MTAPTFATFLDIGYLPKLLVTYQSLHHFHPQAKLFVYCFDDATYQILKLLEYPYLIPVAYPNFESPKLRAQKATKVRYYEYYWSYKPHIILETMRRTKAEVVTYMDCDFLFFSSLQPVFDEMGRADVLIQPNNFSFPEVSQFPLVGYYCSCFESFRNNPNGRHVLKWWHERCAEWCFSKFEEGKFADQKYLDDWRTRFKNVKEISHIGANLAPWNIQKYDITSLNGQPYANTTPVIYYHYHSFRMNTQTYQYIITGDRNNSYALDKQTIKILYAPYITAMKQAIKVLKKFPEFKQFSQKNPNNEVKLFTPDDGTIHFSYREVLKKETS